eukprot:scaffold112096_cov48-Phaeocystis_antarctica.AAC.1
MGSAAAVARARGSAAAMAAVQAAASTAPQWTPSPNSAGGAGVGGEISEVGASGVRWDAGGRGAAGGDEALTAAANVSSRRRPLKRRMQPSSSAREVWPRSSRALASVAFQSFGMTKGTQAQRPRGSAAPPLSADRMASPNNGHNGPRNRHPGGRGGHHGGMGPDWMTAGPSVPMMPMGGMMQMPGQMQQMQMQQMQQMHAMYPPPGYPMDFGYGYPQPMGPPMYQHLSQVPPQMQVPMQPMYPVTASYGHPMPMPMPPRYPPGGMMPPGGFSPHFVPPQYNGQPPEYGAGDQQQPPEAGLSGVCARAMETGMRLSGDGAIGHGYTFVDNSRVCKACGKHFHAQVPRRREEAAHHRRSDHRSGRHAHSPRRARRARHAPS